MTLLSIPHNLDFETVQVLDGLARMMAERRAAATRIIEPSPIALDATINLVIGPANLNRIGSPYWRRDLNATYGRLLQLAAVSLEMADAIARAAELRASPMRAAEMSAGPLRLAPGPQVTSCAQAPDDAITITTLPCDVEPVA